MNITLSPRLVFLSGMGAAGKTTTAKNLSRAISNSFYINRDDVLYGGLLCVDNIVTKSTKLPSFEEYVKSDSISPNQTEVIETPFGEMTRVFHDPPSDFYKRHAKEQSYLIQGRIAAVNLEMDKVPILDGFLMRHINCGSLRAFMDQALFSGFSKYLIHVVVDPDECFRRFRERCENDHEAAIRADAGYLNRETFDKLIVEKHERIPEGLKNFNYLLLDTTELSQEECVQRCLSHINP